MLIKKEKPDWLIFIMVSLITVSIFGACNSTGAGDTSAVPDTTPPKVFATFPTHESTDLAITSKITAIFNEPMDPATIVTANLTLAYGTTLVSGTVIYDIGNRAAIFAPNTNLTENTTYTAKVTTGVTDLAGNFLEEEKVWTFTTVVEQGAGPAPVNLGTAGNFAILAKTGISTVPASAITGNVGISPVAGSYFTGFSQTDATGYATSPQVKGYLYAADMADPTPARMTTAVSDMERAYSEAAGRTLPDETNLGAGEIGGLTITPGLYTWETGVGISTDVTISGNANDVWIFQIAGELTLSNGISIMLSGGAQAENIFWQVASGAILGTTSHFEGIILGQAAITMETGATMNGRALAQSAVTLDQCTIVEPPQY